MATLVHDVAPPAEPPQPAVAPPVQEDAWPHTSRPMPWLVALFVAMVYLIPFDSTGFPISLPFNAGLDRLVLVAISVVWLFVSLASPRPPRFAHTPINVALWVFVVLSVLSLALNLRDLSWDQELSPSVKQLLLTLTYLLFFFVVASSLTRRDALGFCKLIVILGSLSALGTILEYRSHHNLFTDLAHLIPGAHVHFKSLVGVKGILARHSYSGPTKHGLADATLLDAAVPLALAFMTRARNLKGAWPWGLALIILVAGCVATQEKTALVVLVISIAVMIALHPRRYIRYWPLLIVAVIVIRVAAPHSISSLRYQFKVVSSSNSTSGRTTDFPAVAPFLDTHLLFGRGFASYSPKYRILDDQMLQFLIDTGVFGFLAYCAVIFAPVLTVFRRARRSLTLEDDLLGALAAGCVAFFFSNFLYDAFSFRQGPYVFFMLAGLVAAITGRRGTDSDAPPDLIGEPATAGT